jgi:3-isopropylmalate dehydratase small subunit
MRITGYVLKYEGDKARNIDTDVIWPGSLTYHHVSPEEMRRHVMKQYDNEFHAKMAGKNILAVGENFGRGSSREQPAYALRHAGIEAIICPQFSRIFERNALAAGQAAMVSQLLYDAVYTGAFVELDLANQRATADGINIEFRFSEAHAKQVEMGGLIPMIAKERADEYLNSLLGSSHR